MVGLVLESVRPIDPPISAPMRALVASGRAAGRTIGNIDEVERLRDSAPQMGFVLGSVFLIMGLGTGSFSIAALGIIFLAIGFASRKKT